jgi:hypothetical protein
MSILLRVNDSKDGQIQSKLERSVRLFVLLHIGLIALTQYHSANSKRSAKPAAKKRRRATSRGNPRWRPPKTPSATSANGRAMKTATRSNRQQRPTSRRSLERKRSHSLETKKKSIYCFGSFVFASRFLLLFVKLRTFTLYHIYHMLNDVLCGRELWEIKSKIKGVRYRQH